MPRCLTRISFVLLLLTSEVWALGLGEVRLDSALNEPLRAQIELLSASVDELEGLEVALASPETFNRYGIDRPYYLQGLTFELVRSGRADGNYVRVRSPSPMTEPFLTFLVEATWPSGRLLREYTVLLDPPTFAPPAAVETQPAVRAPERTPPADSGQIERPAPTPSPAVTAPAPRTEPVQQPAPQPATTTAPERAVAQQEPKPEPVRDDTPYDAAAGGDYQVARGDTLWGIASSVRPDSRLTMNQTMLAIYEANPEAFGGNINVLRAGATLRLPSADEIYRIDRTTAFNEAKRQNEAWQGGQAITPAPVAQPQPEPEPAPSLTLVPPDEEPAGIDTGMEGDADAEPLTREEEIVERISELEAADVPVQQSLIEIRDNELANLRRELAEIRGEEYEPVTDDASEDPFADDDIVADESDVEPAEGELFPDFGDEESADDTATGEVADEPAADPTTTIARSRDEPGLVDTIMGWVTNIWVLLGAALLVVVGILILFMRRGGDEEPDAWGGRLEPTDSPDATMRSTESLRAPRRDDESIVVVEQENKPRPPVLEEDTIEAESLPEAEGTGTFGSLEDTFSSETAVNLDQSDPIAEADFHMAYGLYDQAADLINGALQAEPEREDLLTKLCEIYFVWGNRDSFIDAADRLQSAAGGKADDWDKIVIMGQQIAPDHELFAGAGIAGATKAVDLAFDDDGEGTGALDMDFGDDAVADDDVIDLGADDGDDDDVIDLGGDDDDGVDFLFDEDAGATADGTVEMPGQEPTVETPTIEEQFSLESTTSNELPSLDEDSNKREAQATDGTAEIDLDDLGLDLDGMDEDDFAPIGDDDATELASLDDLDETGTNESIDSDAETGRQVAKSSEDTGLMEALDVDDDFSTTRTGMRLAVDETGQNPFIGIAEETDPGLDADLLEATGRTQIISENFAVETSDDDDDDRQTIADDEKTMLAQSLSDDDFEFAKTEALPPGTYPGADDDTAESPSLAGEDLDLDLEELSSALEETDRGDTVEQPRDDATVEQPRPNVASSDVETQEFSPDELIDDLNEARTMTEVGTKLDLARAYVDMGDPSGARSILEEVLDEGDSSQKQQAQKLLDSLPS